MNSILPAGTRKCIHVNQSNIKQFAETKLDKPAWIVRTHDGVMYCNKWSLNGETGGIQSLATPLGGCRAVVWIETYAELVLEGVEQSNETPLLPESSAP